MTVGGLELSELPIRASASRVKKTLGSNSNHEDETDALRKEERDRKRMNKLYGVSAVLQLEC